MFVRACLVGCLVLAGVDGDRVVLKSGEALRGRVVYDDGSRLVLRQGREDTPIEWKEIERVQSRARDLHALLDNAARANLGDPDALEFLISQAQEMGLEGEERALWWRLLLADPGNERAHAALGHQRRGKGWVVPLGGRRVALDKRIALASDWGTAWEFDSLHYRVRSSMALPETLDLVFELERFYRAFYGLLGSELRLYEVVRPMGVHVHGAAASYPESGSEHGRYEEVTDIVLVNASDGPWRRTLVHEATHQLLYDTAFRERNTTGTLPPWLNEGLAEYMAVGVGPGPELELGKPARFHFDRHTSAKRPFDLKRVLSFGTGDYLASKDRDLRYAQSYTLVHYLLHAEDGRFRPGLFDFVRLVYDGMGSVTDLEDSLRVDWRELEKGWSAYAEETAR